MAPIHTVREVFTKPSTNFVSRSFLVFSFSHSPKCSRCFSMFNISPMREPMAKEPIIIMVPPLVSPDSVTVIIFSMAPPMPRKMTQSPVAFMMVSCILTFMALPKRAPRRPPNNMPPTLMSVPNPIICISSLKCIFSFVMNRFYFRWNKRDCQCMNGQRKAIFSRKNITLCIGRN